MQNEVRILPPLRLIGVVAIVVAFAAMSLVSPSYAQEAPDASPEAPDENDAQETGTRGLLEVEAPGGGPVNSGVRFVVQWTGLGGGGVG